MSKRVLVTGIGGFAGAYLSDALKATGYQIIGLLSDESHRQNLKLSDLDTFVADLRDANAIGEIIESVAPNYIVHLAAISFIGHGNVNEIYETNIVGTRNLLSAAAKLVKKPESVLLVSSANVYGNSDKGFLTETDEVNPANDYAVSKIAMEYMARQFKDCLNLIIARPFNYTGPGQSANFLIPKIVNHFRERAAFIELGNTDVARDFSDVRMVTQAFLGLLETPAAIGQVYNICTGRPHSLYEIISICEVLTGHKIEIRVNPAFVRANEIKSLAGNPAKLHHDIGQLEDIPIEATLKWMLEA